MNTTRELDFFDSLFTDNLWELLVQESNKCYQQQKAADPNKHKRPWAPVTREEMEAFIRIIILMGIVKLPHFTPLTFDMPPNRTIHNTGEKTIKIRTTGNEKNRVTVVLTCAGDGSKLRPMVIFKRKTLPKVANKHGIVIAAQEKGWMDTERMKIWIEKVWRARRGGLGRRRSLLVLDAFEAHVTDSVKTAIARENTNLAVIPGGLTSILQPLDISLNKPFKDNVRRRWMEWMAEGIHEFTAGGRQKKPSEEVILSWIAGAWNEIPEEMIESSFLKCGITNNIDGSEDHLIYEAEDNDELDDSFVRELFQSDSESEFEGFDI